MRKSLPTTSEPVPSNYSLNLRVAKVIGFGPKFKEAQRWPWISWRWARPRWSRSQRQSRWSWATGCGRRAQVQPDALRLRAECAESPKSFCAQRYSRQSVLRQVAVACWWILRPFHRWQSQYLPQRWTQLLALRIRPPPENKCPVSPPHSRKDTGHFIL